MANFVSKLLMRYLIAILCFLLLSEYIKAASVNESGRNIMSRGRGGRDVVRREPGTNGTLYPQTQQSFTEHSHARGGRGSNQGRGRGREFQAYTTDETFDYDPAYEQAPPYYYTYHQYFGAVYWDAVTEVYYQIQDSWFLLQTVQTAVSRVLQNPLSYGTISQWQGLRGMRHNPYQQTTAVANRYEIFRMALNLSSNNWNHLVDSINHSIHAIDLMSVNSPYTDWSWVRTHLTHANSCLHEGLLGIIFSFTLDSTIQASVENSEDGTTPSTMPLAGGFATPLSSLKSAVSTQDVEVQTEEQQIPEATSAAVALSDLPNLSTAGIVSAVDTVSTSSATTAALHKVLAKGQDEDECKQQPVIATGSQSRKKSKPQQDKWQVVPARIQTASATLKPRGAVATEPKTTKEKKPSPQLTVDETKQLNDERKKAVAAKAAKETQEAEQKKAAALAKVLQELQDKTDSVKETHFQIQSAKAKMQSLLSKAVTGDQKAKLREKIAEMEGWLRKLLITQKAIRDAASKSHKELHELKKGANGLLAEISNDKEDIAEFLSETETAIVAAKADEERAELLKPFVPQLQEKTDGLIKLKVLCTYRPQERFVQLGSPAGNTYHSAIDALQADMRKLLRQATERNLESFEAVLKTHLDKSAQYYTAQKSVLESNIGFNRDIVSNARDLFVRDGYYPKFLDLGNSQKVKFLSVTHYDSIIRMLTRDLALLEASHAAWFEYSSGLMTVLKGMRAAIASKAASAN